MSEKLHDISSYVKFTRYSLLMIMIIINKMAIIMKNREIPPLEIRHISLFYHDQRRQFHILHLNIIGLSPYGMSPHPHSPSPSPSIPSANHSDTIVLLTGYRYSSRSKLRWKAYLATEKSAFIQVRHKLASAYFTSALSRSTCHRNK